MYRSDTTLSPPQAGGQTTMKNAPAAPTNPVHGLMQSQPRNDSFVPVVPPGHYENLHQISGEPYATQAASLHTRKRT